LEDPVSSYNNVNYDSDHNDDYNNDDHACDNNKSAHKAQYAMTEEYHKKKKKMQDEHSTIKELFKKTSKDSSTTMLAEIDNMKFRNMFATWIINRQHLFAIIEDPEFVKIIQYLNLKAQLVKADAIKNTIMSLYNLEKQELK
ncbi:34714_t:CDS:2, partial [Racocetra persica]